MSGSSITEGAAFPRDIVLARLCVIDRKSLPLLEDIKRLVWEYLPPLSPNFVHDSEGKTVPGTFRLFDSDGGRLIHGVSRDLERVIYAVEMAENPSSNGMKKLFALDGDLELGCVYHDQLFYTVYGDAGRVRRRPLQSGSATPAVVGLPEKVIQIKPASGALFFVAERSYKLYMIDSPSAEARQVTTLTKADESEIIEDLGDEEDDSEEEFDSYRPEPIFQDAKIENGKVTEMLYIQGDTMGRLCYWRDGQASVVSPGVHARMCRLVPNTKAGICCGFFGSSWEMCFYVYDIVDHRVFTEPECFLDLTERGEELISLNVRNDWTATLLTSGRQEVEHLYGAQDSGRLIPITLKHDLDADDEEHDFDFVTLSKAEFSSEAYGMDDYYNLALSRFGFPSDFFDHDDDYFDDGFSDDNRYSDDISSPLDVFW
ncbi:hypothetical protein FOL46_005361 [Perkinsus olseni]|uniref:Uncharacterized protein n=1 Tax=Perkinsus olseni TaxID=32597 RepID=A0A7J6LU50_PEROL|nr:hypothetical protein FOL46_005361 [Perkinsus olseni]